VDVKRTLKADEARLWALVASTVRPAHGRAPLKGPAPLEPDPRDLRLLLEGDAPLTPRGESKGKARLASAAEGRQGGLDHPAQPVAVKSPARSLAKSLAKSPAKSLARSPVEAPTNGRRGSEPHRHDYRPLEPHPIEPLRRRRLARERDVIGARLDLHGLDQDRARAALHAFLHRACAQGHRAVLVITGKGALGDGILRRRAPEWLSEPEVRPLIAGVSQADRRHGGAGALYIALKRRHG